MIKFKYLQNVTIICFICNYKEITNKVLENFENAIACPNCNTISYQRFDDNGNIKRFSNCHKYYCDKKYKVTYDMEKTWITEYCEKYNYKLIAKFDGLKKYLR